MAKNELADQSDDYLAGTKGADYKEDDSSAPQLDEIGITKTEFKKLMDDTEQTINIPLTLITGGIDEDGQSYEPVFDPDTGKTQLLNYFQVNPDKGKHYGYRRLKVEHTQFSGLKELDQKSEKIEGKNHPISSALNINKTMLGPGMNYSDGFPCVIVLKDEVRQRTAFSPTDSFKIFEQKITPEGLNRYREILKEYHNGGGQMPLSAEARAKLTDENIELVLSKMQQKLTDPAYGFGHEKSMELEVLLIFYHHLGLQDEDDGAILDVECMFAMSTSSEKPTTYDKLDTLLPKVKPSLVQALKRQHDDDRAINSEVDDYIEGQIFGGVDFTKDVKEIKISNLNDNGRLTNEELAKTREFCQKCGIKLTVVDHEDSKKTSTCKELKNTFLPQAVREKDNSFSSFKKTDMVEILDNYKEHEQKFDLKAIHGRPHICRALILSNVLTGFMREKQFNIDTYGLYRAVGMHDSGREGNGRDIFERASAKKCQKFFASRGININYEAYDSIKSEIGIQTAESMILHSADSYDITRIFGAEGFKFDFLAFGSEDIEQSYNDPKTGELKTVRLLKDDPELVKFRQELVNEAALFAEMGDPLKEACEEYERTEFEVVTNDKLRPEEVNQKLAEAKEKLKRASASITSEQYFNMIEETLLKNPDKFPNMIKYYTP